jgi:membrane protein DedA with SNARE-associated domain
MSLAGEALALDGGLGWRMLLIAAATLVSEDATCVATGLLVAQGAIGFVAGSVACFAGILAGDLMLFWAGRALGRRALESGPLARRIDRAALARASAWLERRGPVVVALSRLTPGMRLPTYFAAGLLETRAPAFALWFGLAAALWTPALVAIAWHTGGASRIAGGSWLAIAALAAVLVAATRALPPLLTHRGRRLAIGRWRRLRHWEFWPLQVFYVPIALYVAGLAVKYRSLLLPTAVNPAIPGGGFAGESKIDILRALAAGSPEQSLRATSLPAGLPAAQRAAIADAFLARAGVALPVVVKPDVGERGSGVVFAHTRDELHAAIAATGADAIVQEEARGLEFGIFYVRHPDEERGRIFSITEKVLPTVTGDGRRTIEELILDDERAVCMARTHLARFAARRDEVLPAGAVLQLVEVGTHSRGAIFRDGAACRTAALEDAIDGISRRYEGFFFGRYDVRVPSVADLMAGRGLRIVELNGLTAEATHVYHPGTPLRAAYRVLFAQWRLAFAIAAANRRRGARPASLREVVRLLRRARPAQRTAR